MASTFGIAKAVASGAEQLRIVVHEGLDQDSLKRRLKIPKNALLSLIRKVGWLIA